MGKLLLSVGLAMSGTLLFTSSASATVSPVASTSAEPCGGGPTRVTPDGIQCSNLPDVAFGPASPDASAFASSSTSASASTLPETGGPVSLMALAPLVLLAGSGILAFRVIRRS